LSCCQSGGRFQFQLPRAAPEKSLTPSLEPSLPAHEPHIGEAQREKISHCHCSVTVNSAILLGFAIRVNTSQCKANQGRNPCMPNLYTFICINLIIGVSRGVDLWELLEKADLVVQAATQAEQRQRGQEGGQEAGKGV
jgi:hypothetical protein